jgi:ACT domain-containing protein
MPRVLSHAEVDAAHEGAVLHVGPEDIVTPLAEERARARGVTISRDAGGGSALMDEITRRVVARMGGSDPALVDAVVSEVARAVGDAGSPSELIEVGPGIDYCAMCVEQERSRSRRRAVLTTTGRNSKGIVARLTARIAELGGDILDISQTIVGDYFTMIIVVDTLSLGVPFEDFKDQIEREAQDMQLQTMMMHEDVVTSLHRV